MAIPFTLLRAFHAVAEHGGFTAAANALGIGQPTVTTQVKELEERYGVELFLRSGRQIQLTGAGEALVEITRRMIALRQDAHDLLVVLIAESAAVTADRDGPVEAHHEVHPHQGARPVG